MKNLFTPAPWKTINMDGKSFPSVVLHGERDGMHGCYIVVNAGHPATMECIQANAKLIAAAPELLEALQAVMNDLPSQPSELTYQLIEAAIKKATE